MDLIYFTCMHLLICNSKDLFHLNYLIFKDFKHQHFKENIMNFKLHDNKLFKNKDKFIEYYFKK